jgi:hypothetical protein
LPYVERPQLHLHLVGEQQRDGEVSLNDLAKVAQSTQQLVTRMARGLAGKRVGRPPDGLVEATRLFLVGLRPGSTVLDIAGLEADPDVLVADDMPVDLGERVLGLLADSARALSEDEPVLPAGLDASALNDLDAWLRDLRAYKRVSLEAELSRGRRVAEFEPVVARRRLRVATPQPPLPFVSSQYQALSGRLYALNLRTGSFSIEDDVGRTIRLAVPEDLRSRAARMVNTRVQAVGMPRLDENGRLLGFDVVDLVDAVELPVQTGFFDRHQLAPSARHAPRHSDQGVIPDLTDDEIDAFVAAFLD